MFLILLIRIKIIKPNQLQIMSKKSQ